MHHQKLWWLSHFNKKCTYLIPKQASIIVNSFAHFISEYTKNLQLELFISDFPINSPFFFSNLEYNSQNPVAKNVVYYGLKYDVLLLVFYFQSLEFLCPIVLFWFAKLLTDDKKTQLSIALIFFLRTTTK